MIIETGANGFNLLIPLLSFSVNVTLQAFLFRSRSCGLLKSEYIGFTLGLVLLLSLQISLHPMLLALTLDALAIVIVNLLIFCGLSYCYFHFINLCTTARRIRLVRDLFASPDGLTLDQILENYNAQDMLSKRIQRLLNSGQIVEQNGRYFVSKHLVLFAAWLMAILKFVFLGKGSEYD